MAEPLPIHDLFIRKISTQEEGGLVRWIALRDQDHLLRRFGQAEVVRVAPDANSDLRMRTVADEVWALLEGQAEFVWHDRRPDSPTHDAQHRVKCHEPTLLLVPFGVAFGFRPLEGEALLLRLATHADGEHAQDHRFPWPRDP